MKYLASAVFIVKEKTPDTTFLGEKPGEVISVEGETKNMLIHTEVYAPTHHYASLTANIIFRERIGQRNLQIVELTALEVSPALNNNNQHKRWKTKCEWIQKQLSLHFKSLKGAVANSDLSLESSLPTMERPVEPDQALPEMEDQQ